MGELIRAVYLVISSQSTRHRSSFPIIGVPYVIWVCTASRVADNRELVKCMVEEQVRNPKINCGDGFLRRSACPLCIHSQKRLYAKLSATSLAGLMVLCDAQKSITLGGRVL
jgi:hypothetical protein